jgi:acetylglutamate kinase
MISELKKCNVVKHPSASQKIVVKLGGSILHSASALSHVVEQIAHLFHQGHQITVVHGAGPQINAYLETRGVVPSFCNGWRITDGQTLMAVYAALGQLNTEIVEALEAAGLPAAALHAEPNLFQCHKKKGVTAKGAPVDLGWVGEIIKTDVTCLGKLDNRIAVVSPLGADHFHNKYNINADHAAFALAAALKADRLVFVSDVPGVLSDKNDVLSVIPTLNEQDIEALIESGKVSQGMIPKLMSSISSAKAGVKAVSIISGNEEAALINLVEGNGPAGTTISASDWSAPFRPRTLTSVEVA